MKSFILLFMVVTAGTTEGNKVKGEQAVHTEEERELQFWTPPGKGLLGKGIGKGVVDDGKGVVGKGIEDEACPPLQHRLSGVDCTTPGKECEGNGIICDDGSVLPTEYCTCVEVEETGVSKLAYKIGLYLLDGSSPSCIYADVQIWRMYFGHCLLS